ncbi:MAG: hypothetical protein K2X27_17105 [Candidatus Obscuribacterales bacterium]|nr:hypothetical protein [Candidatus Obscuribacterales bacterium]
MDRVIEIPNVIDFLKHQNYIAIHSKDGIFPLDGSDWARLVSMRLHPSHRELECEKKLDFWLRLHSDESPLPHERKVCQKGLNHWFLIGNEQYNLDLRYTTESHIDDPVWKHIISQMGQQQLTIDSNGHLKQMDEKWTSENNAYWSSADTEGTEGNMISYRRPKGITKQA